MYNNYSSTIGLFISIAIALFGLITGILFATKILKTSGTIEFISGEEPVRKEIEEATIISPKKKRFTKR